MLERALHRGNAPTYWDTADRVFFCSYKSALEKLNAGKVLEASVIAGYGRVGSSAAMLEICYSEYVEAYYEETGVELEPKDDYDGKVNVFYTNFPG